MTAREQEQLVRALHRAMDALHRANDATDKFASRDVDDAIVAISRVIHAVERAR